MTLSDHSQHCRAISLSLPTITADINVHSNRPSSFPSLTTNFQYGHEAQFDLKVVSSCSDRKQYQSQFDLKVVSSCTDRKQYQSQFDLKVVSSCSDRKQRQSVSSEGGTVLFGQEAVSVCFI